LRQTNLSIFFFRNYIEKMPHTENAQKYYCFFCDFKCCKKSNYDIHLTTRKHIMRNNASCVADEIKCYDCSCGKKYKHQQTLSAHKKLCKGPKDIENLVQNMTDKELIMYLLKENKDFKELILDQSNKMMELATKPTSIINNNNSNNNSNNNNKQFNLQVFLNEKCKNAMNMSEFISSLKIHDEDFENIGKLGYIQGISNIFIKGLKGLDETMRPLHCNDIKRETLYIKDNDVWDKDDNNQKIRNVIALIAHKNFKYIPVWKDANPSASDVTTSKNDLYMRISNQVTTCITPDDDSGINKIIRNVANKVIIDKENYI